MNAPMALIALVSMLISVVSAGATAVSIGAKAVARLPFRPFSAPFRLSSAPLTAGVFCDIASKPSLMAVRSFRNSMNRPRIPRPYFRMDIRLLLSPPSAIFAARLKPNMLLAAPPIRPPSFFMPPLTAFPANFASWIAAFFAPDASFFKKPTAAVPANRPITARARPAEVAMPANALFVPAPAEAADSSLLAVSVSFALRPSSLSCKANICSSNSSNAEEVVLKPMASHSRWRSCSFSISASVLAISFWIAACSPVSPFVALRDLLMACV